MTKEDLIKHLGTIADSGTSEFFKKFENSDTEGQNDLIGKFGVGFYSSFLVSEKVAVISKHNDDQQYIWTSDASSYTVVPDPSGNTLGRGTKIILFLREESREFLEVFKLDSMCRKFSQFLSFPIYLRDKKNVYDSDESENKEPRTEEYWKHVNTVKPLWQRKFVPHKLFKSE
ncbi:endoplasmin-like [Octopus sinensis]|uniref:Endoplasmin-like n=1 Tax=Octopus sinensis TaxID=2607531 RepID=A0A6P7TQU8_9MOLL|nr:endoplasmin-like [Octopus sinensis]XP_029657531.1 endoplasmin-like [Octopus sinensis]